MTLRKPLYADAEIIVWTKRRGDDVACAGCDEPVTIGDEFAFVRLRSGPMGMLHKACAEREAKK